MQVTTQQGRVVNEHHPRVLQRTDIRLLPQWRTDVFSWLLFTLVFELQLYMHARFFRSRAPPSNSSRSHSRGVITTRLLFVFYATLLLIWRLDAFIMRAHRDAV
jgi:Na+/proline symporter